MPPTTAPHRQALFLASLFIVFYVVAAALNLGYLPLNGDEPRRAVVSIEMLHSGNFIMPTTLGWEYYNKPPVYNWIMSFCMFITGSTGEFPVRLPSLIFIVIWGIVNYFIVKRVLHPTIALLSSLFLVTSMDMFFWGLSNGGEIDVFYSFIVYLQVIFLFYFNEKRKWSALFIVSYFFCAIGFLTKGFPSLVFEALTLAALCAYNRSLRVIFRWQHILGIGVLGLLVGGYLYAYSFYSSPGRLLADLLKEAFNKSAFGENSEQLFKKMAAYPFSFLKILMPWSLLLLLLFKKHRFRLWSNPLIRFSLLFILFNIPVYWITGHPRMRYVYMFIPFSMFILAYIFYHFREEFPALIKRIGYALQFFFIILLAGIILSPFFIRLSYTWVGVAAVLLLLFILQYRRSIQQYVWWLGGGIVVMRLVYAVLFIPARYERTPVKYNHEMQAMAVLNNGQPISIFKKADVLDLLIDLKVSKLNLGTIPALPYLAYQMPYYYYQNTGQIMKFDTVLQHDRNYIGFRSELDTLRAEIQYSFRDYNQNNDDIVLFSVPSR